MLNRRELFGPGCADLEARGVLADQVREARLDSQVSRLEGVVRTVGNLRCVIPMIGDVMGRQLVGQGRQFLQRLGFGKVCNRRLRHASTPSQPHGRRR